MKYLDFQPLAEFADRHNTIRPIYGTTIMGRYEFADRMSDIEQMLNEADEFVTWESLYISNARFRHAIDKALDCWGIDPDWLTPAHIEQLLFMRGDECGWLIELSKGSSGATKGQGEGQTLAETLATISTHCQSLQEALDLANTVPADLLVEVLNARAGMGEDKPNPKQQEKERYIKENFDELMARF